MSHQQQDQMEMGPLKVPSERLERLGINLATPGLVVHLGKTGSGHMPQS